MRKIICVVMAIFSTGAMAETYTRNIDIINNSNIPLKITYNLCTTVTTNDSTSNENCIEKMASLSAKGGKTNKISFQADTMGGFEGVYTQVFIGGIYSSLGKQIFASSHAQEMNTPDLSSCSDSWPAGGSSRLYPRGNTIILDNMGTEKFYCAIAKLES